MGIFQNYFIAMFVLHLSMLSYNSVLINDIFKKYVKAYFFNGLCYNFFYPDLIFCPLGSVLFLFFRFCFNRSEVVQINVQTKNLDLHYHYYNLFDHW